MKRFLVILFLIPSLAFGAFTEFYCQSGGSNLNAGSTTNNTAAYTSAGGNWVQSTGVFTVTDGTNPSLSVSVGDWVSVYVTAGATLSAWIARVSAVQNATNGTITANTTGTGSKPSNGTGTITLKAGGAWLGPNAATGFPFILSSYGNNQDATSHQTRTNLKNNQTYSLTSAFSIVTSGKAHVIQGYTSSTGDGGKATFDGGTSTGTLISSSGIKGNVFSDLIFSTSITSGTSDLVTEGNSANWIRCVFTGSRQTGLATQIGTSVTECEFYSNNKANTATTGALHLNGGTCYRSIFHDNTGSNTSGIKLVSTGACKIVNCIFDTNGKYGILDATTTQDGINQVSNSDFYNNGSDGINIASAALNPYWIENCNFIKNTGAGINNVSVIVGGYVYNCGYGAGTQANGSADTTNNLTVSGAITYGSNLTPWTDPANGDFSINLAAAQGAGRGVFTETATSYAGTVGYPDIGAAQATPGCTFPTPTATPTATATATATATNTPTPTPSATFTPTITPCAPTPTATATWTPTPTFTPTSTPTATATSTPTPTPTPSATSTPTATACAGGEVSYNHSD